MCDHGGGQGGGEDERENAGDEMYEGHESEEDRPQACTCMSASLLVSPGARAELLGASEETRSFRGWMHGCL